ncbi:MAG TPA: endolytic transglycosylase MltG, partial [Polyangiaceae bacterium]|nr:endolytic transglycosylase MltG [Polyangiaceae bacterium]
MTKPRRRKSQRPPAPSLAPPAPSSSAPPSSGTSRRKRKRRRAAKTPPEPRSSAPPRGPRRAFGRLFLRLGLMLALGLAPLFAWSLLPGPGSGKLFSIEVPPAATVGELSELLVARGALSSPRLFRWSLALLHPGFDLAPGEHLLNDRASARELALRLEHSPARASERVTLPEGFQHVQIGERLEHAEVCTLAAFRRAVKDPALLRELGVPGASAEGYLFPATYGLLADSDAREVVRVLVAETKKRLEKLDAAHPGRLAQLARDFGLQTRDVLTLASMIEKEAREPDERPLVASVFFNRLKDPEFRPQRMLQSDPTASYGCLVMGPDIPSCADFKGSVTPALLRDPANPYNTYRHAGLPPGPIANPGAASIEAVLAPATSD